MDNVCSRRILLKLCNQYDDVIDVDYLDINTIQGRVCFTTVYSKKYEDGSVEATVPLGRNNTTGINKTFLSRALCNISFGCENNKQQLITASAFLSMCKPPGENKHKVHIDGKIVDKSIGEKVPLKHGSIISLYGPTGFAYEVSINNRHEIEEELKESQRLLDEDALKVDGVKRILEDDGQQNNVKNKVMKKKRKRDKKKKRKKSESTC